MSPNTTPSAPSVSAAIPVFTAARGRAPGRGPVSSGAGTAVADTDRRYRPRRTQIRRLPAVEQVYARLKPIAVPERTAMPLFFFTVEQQERAIVERFGKFVRVAGPGLQR